MLASDAFSYNDLYYVELTICGHFIIAQGFRAHNRILIASPDRQKTRSHCLKSSTVTACVNDGVNILLWLQICLGKQRRVEKVDNADLQSLAHFVNDPELDGIVGTVDHIPDGRFRNTAANIQLILSHLSLVEQFCQTCADSLVEFHIFTIPVAVPSL